jgi:hypothetical protein
LPRTSPKVTADSQGLTAGISSESPVVRFWNVPLLELALRRNLITLDQHTDLKSNLEEIARMLSGLIKGLENREVLRRLELQ